MVSALVRTNDPQRPQQPPTLYLNPLPGDQYAAALRAAPTAPPALRLPARALDDPGEPGDPDRADRHSGRRRAARRPRSADPPVQRDDLVMLALTDPQRATRIVDGHLASSTCASC